MSCLLAGFTFAASARAATVGVNSDITWGIPSASVSQEVSMIQQAGIPWIRATIDLSGAEYYGPQLNMSYLSPIDAAVQAARSAGLNVLLELDRAPYWASADPNKYTDSSGGLHWNPYWKYTNPQQYAQVVTDVVNHYKAMGVNTFELWNEPNNPSFWPSGPSASDYVALLKAAYPAVKAADPSAVVLMGGLQNDGSYPAYTYLQQMYDAGAKGYYDVANFHIYPGGDPTQCSYQSTGVPTVNSFCLLDALHSEMMHNGDNSTVSVTELGWSTCSQTWCVTPQQQASYITSAYNLLSGSAYSYVKSAFIYQLRDLYMDTSNTSWESSLGVMGRDFTPKPAYYALKSLSSATGGAAPTVSLTSPTSGASLGSSVVATATATDPVGIARVTFAIDGKVVTTASQAPYSATLSTKKLATGSHVITATAYDPAGRSASSSVTVTKSATATAAAFHGARASLSLRLRSSGVRARVVSGHVTVARGRVSGRVALVLQRRSPRGWQTAAVDRAALHHGGYVRRLRLARGAWRIWVSFDGTRSRSHLFRVT